MNPLSCELQDETVGFAVRLEGENPGVFSEASCYLPWIADSYGMELGNGLATGCRPASGDISDRNKTSCRAFNGDMCKFIGNPVFNNTIGDIMYDVVDESASGISFDRCLFMGQGLTRVQMTYVCLTSNYSLSTCANNCLGVEASDIIAGGAALLAATATGGAVFPGLLPVLGLGGLGLAGAGIMAMMGCVGPLYCLTDQGSCCLLVFDIAVGLQCPNSC